MQETINTPGAPSAIGPYAQATVVNGFVFTSGQLPIDPVSGELIDTIGEATRQSLDNVRAILEAAGSSMAKVVKTTVFLRDLNDFAAMNDEYARHFTQPLPARSTVQVAKLPKDAIVEIEVIAVVG